MGEFSRNLFDVNGDTGHTYRLRSEGAFGLEELDKVRYYAMERGHIAVMSCMEPRIETTEGGYEINHDGLIKLNPGLTAEELREMRQDGIFAEALNIQ